MAKKLLRTIGGLSALMLLAACPNGDDENANNTDTSVNNTEVTSPAVPEGTLDISAWDEQYVLNMDDINVVLPAAAHYTDAYSAGAETMGRLYQMDAIGFCPSLSGQVSSMDEYTVACTDIIQDKMQYAIDVYACRGHGDAFYAAVPTSTKDAYSLFSSNPGKYFSEQQLFTQDSMRRQFENFANDTYTVHTATAVGEQARSFSAAMDEYITNGRGLHYAQTPTCSADYKFNLGQ